MESVVSASPILLAVRSRRPLCGGKPCPRLPLATLPVAPFTTAAPLFTDLPADMRAHQCAHESMQPGACGGAQAL